MRSVVFPGVPIIPKACAFATDIAILTSSAKACVMLDTAAKVLVTGGNGFVGSRLVRALVQQGYTVKLMVREGANVRALRDLPQHMLQFCTGDITCYSDMYRALVGCDRMFHVAAVYKMFSSKPRDIEDAAMTGTKTALDAALHRNVSKVVVTSSIAAIGVNPKPEPMDESWQFNLNDSETYVVAKRKAETLALSYVKEGLDVVAVNPTGVFGPGDWKPTPSGQSILMYLTWPFSWGFPSSSGGLNVVDVDDVAAGHIAAMDRGQPGQRYILGGDNVTYEQMFCLLAGLTSLSGPGFSAPRFAAMIGGWLMQTAARVRGEDAPLSYKLARDYVGKYQWVTSQKAEKYLGYRYRSAREVLLRSVQWYIDNGYLTDRQCNRIHLAKR